MCHLKKLILSALTAAFLLFVSGPAYGQQKKYKPTEASLKAHEVPKWYQDAKLGIFIHWGLYSVPAWAPLSGELGSLSREEWFKNNAYAEWYLNTMRIDGSPTQKHHYETYGKDFDYYNFASTFNKEVKKWDPQQMADLFKQVHARYVVLTSKHHEGFLLWPSTILNPYLPRGERHASRDIIGELTQAVRKDDMRMGFYYSGGIDWSFKPIVIDGSGNWGEVTPNTDQYAHYADAQWRELIHKYKPAILWNDITYPKKGGALEIFADYYNTVSDGVINNRWGRDIHDFTTPEYKQYDKITPQKWETCRGIDYSFGYNQNSTADQMLTVDELVDMFVDIVSKNGNLLLDVGPKADGTIPELQVERLKGLGQWLDVNGEAIFGTQPWLKAESNTTSGVPVRFTFKKGKLFAILLEKPGNSKIRIPDLIAEDGTMLHLLGSGGTLHWKNEEEGMSIELPAHMDDAPAYTISFSAQPMIKMKK